VQLRGRGWWLGDSRNASAPGRLLAQERNHGLQPVAGRASSQVQDSVERREGTWMDVVVVVWATFVSLMHHVFAAPFDRVASAAVH